MRATRRRPLSPSHPGTLIIQKKGWLYHTRPPCGRQQMDRLWNQKGADSGSFLVARMAASYS
jgi:hypothetical protein